MQEQTEKNKQFLYDIDADQVFLKEKIPEIDVSEDYPKDPFLNYEKMTRKIKGYVDI